MRVAVRALIVIVIGIGCLRGPFAMPSAHAGPLEKPTLTEARNHLVLGNKLYNVRSFDEAVAEYKAGALVESAPVFDYNLGQCYRLTGKYQEAIWHYERFLARGKPEGKLLDSVTDFLSQMRSELDKKAMTQTPTEPAPTQAPVSPVQLSHTQPATQPSEYWYADKLGWAITAAGVASTAVGAGFLLNGANLSDQADGNPSQQERNALYSKSSTRNVLGIVFGVGGAGLLVTGVVKLAIHSDQPSRGVGLTIAPTANGLMAFGRY
jgi:hypothetical protein